MNTKNRHSIRLKGYDYSQPGAYFITICIQNKQCLLGNIVNRKMIMNDSGIMVRNIWQQLPKRFNHINTEIFIVMPNHVHGIISIHGRGESCIRPESCIHPESHIHPESCTGDHKDRPYGTLPNTIGRIVQAFKSTTTLEYVHGVNQSAWIPFEKKLWQRNYYEHIIRDQKDFNRIYEYIENNPLNWQSDCLNARL